VGRYRLQWVRQFKQQHAPLLRSAEHPSSDGSSACTHAHALASSARASAFSLSGTRRVGSGSTEARTFFGSGLAGLFFCASSCCCACSGCAAACPPASTSSHSVEDCSHPSLLAHCTGSPGLRATRQGWWGGHEGWRWLAPRAQGRASHYSMRAATHHHIHANRQAHTRTYTCQTDRHTHIHAHTCMRAHTHTCVHTHTCHARTPCLQQECCPRWSPPLRTQEAAGCARPSRQSGPTLPPRQHPARPHSCRRQIAERREHVQHGSELGAPRPSQARVKREATAVPVFVIIADSFAFVHVKIPRPLPTHSHPQVQLQQRRHALAHKAPSRSSGLQNGIARWGTCATTCGYAHGSMKLGGAQGHANPSAGVRLYHSNFVHIRAPELSGCL